MSFFTEIMKGLSSGRRISSFPGKLEPDGYGLVHVGGKLTVCSLAEAYARGCFPWTGSHPIPWFSPDPRLVLFPKNFSLSKRLRRLVRQRKFTIRFDHDFRSVMENCASIPRKGEKGTWITENMKKAYGELHDLHIGHSVEVYDGNGDLCGGLYGLTFGRAFFGESMFSHVPNTSKLALHALCEKLAEQDFDFIDCQQVTAHMMRLGAVPIPRGEFMRRLRRTLLYDSFHKSWKKGVFCV